MKKESDEKYCYEMETENKCKLTNPLSAKSSSNIWLSCDVGLIRMP